MASSTVELRNLLQLKNFNLFGFDYEFDDKATAKLLEEEIEAYFFFSEIGTETPDRFLHVFQSKYKRIMRYYNNLHNTSLLQYDPLVNYRLSENLEKLHQTKDSGTIGTTKSETIEESESNVSAQKGNTTTTNNTSSNNTATESETGQNIDIDFPQNTIAGDYRSDESNRTIDRTKTDTGAGTSTGAGTTKSDVTMTKDSDVSLSNQSNTIQANTQDGTESYEKVIEGITGITYQDLIAKERKNILRMSEMIINELKPCFMLTY